MADSSVTGKDVSSALETYKRLLTYGFEQKRYFVIAVAGMLLYSLTDAGFAALVKPLFDESLLKQDKAFGLTLALAVLGVLFLRGVGAYLAGTYLAYVSHSITRNLRAKVFRHMLGLKLSYFDAHPAGTLISKLTYNVPQAAGAVSKALTILIRDSLTVIALLAWMFYLSWILTSVLLLAAPLVVILLRYINKRFRSASSAMQNTNALLTKDIDQMIRGIHSNKIFGADDSGNYQLADFEKNNELLRRYSIRFARAKAIATPTALFIVGAMLSAIIYLLAFEGIAGYISTGSIASFFVSLVMLMRPIRSLVNINPIIQQGIVGADSAFEIIDLEPEKDSGQRVEARFTGALRFENVSYAYQNNERPALKGISFEACAGQMIAIVGHSGSGKSTLINMIPRFYDPDQGSIRFDGHDARELSLQQLREQISYVGQSTELLHDTVRNNITYGQTVDQALLDAVLKKACVDEFANKLPQGIDTLIGGEGVQLSAGQCQRVAVARALLREVPILIFDEATSFLDNETEQVIRTTLEGLAGQRTVFVIAHRLATVEHADLILVMDAGRIVEQGQHADLLARQGVYHALYSAGQDEGLIE